MLKNILLIILITTPFLLGQSKDVLKLELESKNLPFGLITYQPKALPKTAIVLSGGGSRGLTQLGILRVLEERQIPINSIVGTSMGSIIGGLYSSGYTTDDLDSIIVNAPWLDFFSLEKADRRELFLDQKITEDKSLLVLRMNGLTPVIPTSINTGLKVSSFINLLSLNAPIKYEKSFDELLFRFRAVATNLVDGKSITISDGPLSEALRASSSISFLLPPIKKDSLLLVDGGVISNIPVDVAKKMDNNFIIAVNSTSDLKDVNELVYPWEIADQLVSIPGKILSDQQMSMADVVIQPDLGDIETSDFSNVQAIIQNGYISALSYIDTIEAGINSSFCNNLNIDEKYYYNLVLPKEPTNIEISLVNKYKFDKKISNKSILFDLYQLQKSGDYESVHAEIISSKEADTLKIIEKLNPTIKVVEYDGISIITEDFLKRNFSVLYTAPYNSKQILKVIQNLFRRYRQLGYPLPWLESLYFTPERGSLTINVNEGKIDEITISGNEKTNENVIRREFEFKNKYLNFNELEDGMNNLRSSNLFSEIKVDIKKDFEKTVLNVNVEERITRVIRFGLRADNEYKVQLHFDIREENLFGAGTDLGAIISGAERIRSFIIEHRAHRIFDTYLTYSLRGYYQFNDIRTYTNVATDNPKNFKREKSGEYRQIFYGGTIGIGTQIQKTANIIAEGKYEYNQIKGISDFPEQSTYYDKLVSIKLKLNIDSQDKYPYPVKGSYLNTYYETSQKFLGGDISFVKFYADYKGYFSLSTYHNLNVRVQFGFGDETLPLSQQFSLGGQSNFFGYRDYEFRGRQVYTTSLEYRYLLPVKLFFPAYLRARYDIGSIWKNRENLKFSDFRHGTGLTLSLDSPFGPADFSVGRSFVTKKAKNGYIISKGPIMFYFTIGYYF